MGAGRIEAFRGESKQVPLVLGTLASPFQPMGGGAAEGSRGDGQNLSAKLIRVGTTFVVQTLITMFWSTFLSFRIVDPCCERVAVKVQFH